MTGRQETGLAAREHALQTGMEIILEGASGSARLNPPRLSRFAAGRFAPRFPPDIRN